MRGLSLLLLNALTRPRSHTCALAPHPPNHSPANRSSRLSSPSLCESCAFDGPRERTATGRRTAAWCYVVAVATDVFTAAFHSAFVLFPSAVAAAALSAPSAPPIVTSGPSADSVSLVVMSPGGTPVSMRDLLPDADIPFDDTFARKGVFLREAVSPTAMLCRAGLSRCWCSCHARAHAHAHARARIDIDADFDVNA